MGKGKIASRSDQISVTRDDFDHVRRAHSLLVIASVVFVYLSVATWNSAPELNRELKELRARLSVLSELNPPDSRSMLPLIQNWANRYAKNLITVLNTKVPVAITMSPAEVGVRNLGGSFPGSRFVGCAEWLRRRLLNW